MTEFFLRLNYLYLAPGEEASQRQAWSILHQESVSKLSPASELRTQQNAQPSSKFMPIL